jgi:hypothetical protein
MSRRAMAVAVVALVAWTASLIPFRGGNWQAIVPLVVISYLVLPCALRFRRHWPQALKAYGGILVYAFLLGMRNALWSVVWLRAIVAIAAGAVLGAVILSEIRYLIVRRAEFTEQPAADS